MTNSACREAYDDKKFETAFQSVLQMDKKDYPIYIGGMMVASGVEEQLHSPIDDTIGFGRFQEPELGTVEEAVTSSLKTFETWSAVSLEERIQIFERLSELAEAQRYRLAAVVLLSTGMTRQEAVFETDALLDIISGAVSDMKTQSGKAMGVWAVIASHNSPLASPIGYAIVAMLAGNTVVLMPSKYSPVPAYVMYDLCEKAGIPGGVLNLIMDRKDRVQIDLANDPRLAGVTISGSGKNLEDMMFLMVDDELSFHNELKGMNPIFVYKPADMRKAVKDVIDSAFKYMGQHLFSTSKVVITLDDQKRFTDMLIEQMKLIKVDDPADPEAFCGPMISLDSKKQYDETLGRVSGYVIFGGKKVVSEFTKNGVYMTPAIITGLDDEDDLAYMDQGLPILYVKMVSNIEEAFEELAYTECGLSAGLYSKDPKVIERFKEEADLPCLFFNESSSTLKPGIYAKVENFLK